MLLRCREQSYINKFTLVRQYTKGQSHSSLHTNESRVVLQHREIHQGFHKLNGLIKAKTDYELKQSNFIPGGGGGGPRGMLLNGGAIGGGIRGGTPCGGGGGTSGGGWPRLKQLLVSSSGGNGNAGKIYKMTFRTCENIAQSHDNYKHSNIQMHRPPFTVKYKYSLNSLAPNLLS